ncbi:MAG: 50S ribosomal protein L28 [Candidatus Margulisiibacteriota bacterium]|nr:50S ribosomal protein L28 [Candidatus Margulisiibacteriota bacterium]
MSKKCVYCGKKPRSGNTVSHSNRHSKRRFNPNLQKMNIIFEGKKIKDYVCTKCLKAGKAIKAV